MPDGENKINVENNPALLRMQRNFRNKSEEAFRDMADELGNKMHVYYELIPVSNGGAHRLIKR